MPSRLARRATSARSAGRLSPSTSATASLAARHEVEPRLDDFQRYLAAPAPAGREAPEAPAEAARGGGWQFSPLFGVLAIAILGVMLLLGVLIGKEGDEVTVAEVPASTTTTATPTTTTPTDDADHPHDAHHA